MVFEQHRLIGNDSSRWVHAPNAIEHGGILIVNRYGERAKRVNRTGFSDHQIRCRPLSVDVPRYLRRLIRAPSGSGLFRMRFPEGLERGCLIPRFSGPSTEYLRLFHIRCRPCGELSGLQILYGVFVVSIANIFCAILFAQAIRAFL